MYLQHRKRKWKKWVGTHVKTLAGIIWDSGAASIRDCHVLVELGITKPNSKNHSGQRDRDRHGAQYNIIPGMISGFIQWVGVPWWLQRQFLRRVPLVENSNVNMLCWCGVRVVPWGPLKPHLRTAGPQRQHSERHTVTTLITANWAVCWWSEMRLLSLGVL